MACWHKGVTKNKTFEIQLDYFKESSWFDIEIKLTRKQDHAGFQFNVEILGLYFHIWLCDNRHWDHENNKWEVYEEEKIWGTPKSRYKGADQGTLGPDD